MLSTNSRAFLPDLRQPFEAAGMIEPLWQQRHIERTGLLTQLVIPVTGTAPPPTFADQLAAVLDERWAGRADLTGGATIRSVGVRIEERALALPTLTLTFTTDSPISAESLAGPRMAGELRRAIRDLRRGYELPLPLAA